MLIRFAQTVDCVQSVKAGCTRSTARGMNAHLPVPRYYRPQLCATPALTWRPCSFIWEGREREGENDVRVSGESVKSGLDSCGT